MLNRLKEIRDQLVANSDYTEPSLERQFQSAVETQGMSTLERLKRISRQLEAAKAIEDEWIG